MTRTGLCWKKWHTLPVGLLPVKLALVVHRAGYSEYALRLATMLPWAAIRACHVHRAYHKDELFVPTSLEIVPQNSREMVRKREG